MLAPRSGLADGPPKKNKPLFRDFIGLNVHTVQFKPDLYRPVAHMSARLSRFQVGRGRRDRLFTREFPFARNRVDWGSMYGSWNKAGYSIDVSLMFDDTGPAAWRDLKRDGQEYGLQFARFFGPSSRKLVESVEIGNEPGNYDDAAYRSLFESVAQGMRRGDPKLLISTCAVYARPSGPYHKNIAVLKGLESLYDVLSVHSYAEAEGYPTWRRSYPEDRTLEFLPKIREMISWRRPERKRQVDLADRIRLGFDDQAPGHRRNLQEMGRRHRPRAGPVPGSRVPGLLQLDLDRAFIFWFNDEDVASVHASSGLTRHYQPKPSFHAVAHLLATLGDFRFDRVVTEKPGELYVIAFRHGTNPDRSIWIAWSPTGKARTATVRLKLSGEKVERAERMPASARPPLSPCADNSREDGEVELEISESPIYLWLRPG